MLMGWDEIEAVEGFAGLKAHADSQVLPVLHEAGHRIQDQGKLKGRLAGVFFAGIIGFFILTIAMDVLLPSTWWGEWLSFVLFPLIFFGAILGALFLFRDTLLQLMLQTKAHFLLRGKALSLLVQPLELTYVASPGGVPPALKWVANQKWALDEVRQAATVLDDLGGMDGAVLAARQAGLMVAANVHIMGTPEQKARHQEMLAMAHRIEDGFHGQRGGLDFEMFEWVETVENAPDIHHLVIVLEAPFPLHGVTQMRSQAMKWPVEATDVRFSDVDLGPREFGALYRLRSTDQVEARAIFNPAVIERVIALADGGAYRAVGKGERLVFDFPGTDRFALVDMLTGVWSEETLRRTAGDIAAAMLLVDALAHAFMLARNSDRAGA